MLPLKWVVAPRARCEFQQSMATIFDSPGCRPLKDSPKPKLIKSLRTIKDSSGSGLNMVWIGTTDMNSRCSHMILRARTASAVFISTRYLRIVRDRFGWAAISFRTGDSLHETFTHYRLDAGEVANYVSPISQDRTGMLWLATGSGLFRLNPDTAQIIHSVHDPANPSSLGSNQVRYTLEDRTGRFWVADGENLEEFDRESGRVLSRVRLSAGIRLISFYEDHLGVFWITYITSSTGSGLVVLDRSTNRLIPYSICDRKSGKELPAGFMAATEDNSQTLSQSESDPECPLHDKNSLPRARRINAVIVSVREARGRTPIIMANRVWTHARRLG